MEPARFTAHFVGNHGAPALERSGDLTPYAAEGLADDVRRAAWGTRLDLYVGSDCAAAVRAIAFEPIVRLRGHGIVVRIHG